MREPDPDHWLHPGVEVRVSDIAGRGLFAAEEIAAGTVVSRFAGRTVDIAFLGNHSCDPNLGWLDDYSLETLLDVGAGVELVSDYATSNADPEFYLRCRCPSARCRQMVEGTDWQITALQRRYAGHWPPQMQRLIDSRTTGKA